MFWVCTGDCFHKAWWVWKETTVDNGWTRSLGLYCLQAAGPCWSWARFLGVLYSLLKAGLIFFNMRVPQVAYLFKPPRSHFKLQLDCHVVMSRVKRPQGVCPHCITALWAILPWSLEVERRVASQPSLHSFCSERNFSVDHCRETAKRQNKQNKTQIKSKTAYKKLF